jgi:hypothetical protein
MATLSVPSRTDYAVDLQVGTTISATITISEKSVSIAPAKSAAEYAVVESTSANGSMIAFPAVS